MNNPNDVDKPNHRLSSFETHADTKKPDVKMVWLLNLIPYSGAGYFYALGVKQAIVPMIFIWMFLLICGPGTLIPMYFIISVLGTAHILNKNSEHAKKLRQLSLGRSVELVPVGQQIPLAESSEYSLSTLESKAKKAAKTLKRVSSDEDYGAKSKHAFEAFEYKAQAAEKMLKARNSVETAHDLDPDPAINFAPAATLSFSDDDKSSGSSSNSNAISAAPSAVPQHVSLSSPNMVPEQLTDSSEYMNQVNSSYSIDSEVAGITAGVSRGATANSTEVNDFLKQADAANDASLNLAQFGESLQASQKSESDMTGILAGADQSTAQIQSTISVPDIGSQIAPSDSYVPDVTSQYSTEPVALPGNTSYASSGSATSDAAADLAMSVPDVSSEIVRFDFRAPPSNSFLVNSDQSVPDISSELVNSTQVAPEMSSMFVDSTQVAPEVNTMFVDSTQVAPEVNAMFVDSTQLTPDVSSMFVNSSQFAPDVSSQVVNSTQSAPDVSSQLVNSTQVAPDVSSQIPDSSLSSFGNFESPKFSFSFDDHMAAPLADIDAPTATNAALLAPCKCGAVRDANFSFCLACGQSFL